MFQEFRKFVLRGNVVDLAVGIVVGAAFNSVIQSLVKDMITPIISIFGGTKHFADAAFTIHKSQFLYGDFINAVISFLIIAAAVFFFVVQPINKLNEIAQRSKGTPDATTKKCPFCFTEINKQASRCPACTTKLAAEKA